MILVISASQKKASDLADMFRYMGLLTLATTPHAALSKVCYVYRAVILMFPNELPDYHDYVNRLRTYSPTSMIFSVSRKDESIDTSIFEGGFNNTTYASNMIKKINEFAVEHHVLRIGMYRRFRLDLSVFHTTHMIRNKPFILTKTECMVLRYLIQITPHAATAEEIIKHIYSPSKAPNPANIRTYVSIINKKGRILNNGKNIISPVKGKGYVYNEV